MDAVAAHVDDRDAGNEFAGMLANVPTSGASPEANVRNHSFELGAVCVQLGNGGFAIVSCDDLKTFVRKCVSSTSWRAESSSTKSKIGK